ncbi:MAG: hypothetical protein ACTSPD_07335 [Promethearchaeota archaeon]
MEDVSKISLNKEWDLNFLYEMIKQSLNSGDIKQSLKISERAIKEAKKIGNNSWIIKFDILHSEILSNHLRRKIDRQVKRANQEKAIFQYEKAINFLKKAKTNLNKLYKLGKNGSKISKEIKKIDKTINQLLDKNNLKSSQILSDEKEELEIKEDYDYELQNLSQKNEKIIPYYDLESDVRKIENKEKKKGNPSTFEEIEDTDDIIQEFLQPQNNNNKKSDEELKISLLNDKNKVFYNEELNLSQIKSYLRAIKEDLKLLGYFIVPKLSNMDNDFYNNIDIIGIKIIQIKDDLDLIIIVPIKIFELKGALIVSENYFDYNPFNENDNIDDWDKNTALNLNIKNFINAQNNLFQNINSERQFFYILKKFIKNDFSIEKKGRNNQLFFHSGMFEYKILIEPVLVCQNNAGFIEKSIPFAYQRKTNLHIVDFARFQDLIKYLEKKYKLLENYSERDTSINRYFKALNKFTSDIRLFSVPFIIFGFIFLLILVFQVYFLIKIFINISYGAIFIYSFVLFYLYRKFSVKKLVIKKEFKTPYHFRPIEINDADLLLIREHLKTNIMDQFLYECFGKNVKHEIIETLEQNKEKEHYLNIKLPENDFNVDIINDNQLKVEKFSNNNLKDKLIEKYSSFLED